MLLFKVSPVLVRASPFVIAAQAQMTAVVRPSLVSQNTLPLQKLFSANFAGISRDICER
jgi:hypothetical protein